MNHPYPYKHWLTSLALGPLILVGKNIIEGNENFTNAVEIYVVFVAFGIIFSLPAFLVYLVVFYLLVKRRVSAVLSKIVLNLLTIFCILITANFTDGNVVFIGLYSAAVVISSFFYRIYVPVELEEESLEPLD